MNAKRFFVGQTGGNLMQAEVSAPAVERSSEAGIGQTLHTWDAEAATMRRCTRNHGIAGGFRPRMDSINRLAYGSRNFSDFGMRVMCFCD